MPKKISTNQILEGQYRKLLTADYIPDGDDTAIISRSLEVSSELSYFLYGCFLRFGSPVDLSKFKPFTIPSLHNSAINKIQSTHRDSVLEIALTDSAASNLAEQFHGRYSEIIIMSGIALCEHNYEQIPFLDELIQVPDSFNEVLDEFTAKLSKFPQGSDAFMINLLDRLNVLNQSGDEDLQKITGVFLSVYRDLIINFFISFAPVYESDWYPMNIEYKSPFNNLSAKAFVSKMFFTLEKCYLNFFTRKFSGEQIDLPTVDTKFLDSIALKKIQDIDPVKVDHTLLAGIEATFMELVTPLIFKHVIIPSAYREDFVDHLKDFKVYFSFQAIKEMQSLFPFNIQMSRSELNTFCDKYITNPKKILQMQAKKSKKKRKKPSVSARVDQNSANQSQQILRIQHAPIESSVRAQEIFSLQSRYFSLINTLESKKTQLTRLQSLLDQIDDCLAMQEDISSPEVASWFENSLEKTLALTPAESKKSEFDPEFTALIGSFDRGNLSMENKKLATEIVDNLESAVSQITFEIKAIITKINSNLQTLNFVIRRLFRNSIDQEPVTTQTNDVFECPISTNIEHIKSAFANHNPRLENIQSAKIFFKLLDCEIRSGGKHLAVYSGERFVCPLSMTTIQEGKLYLKAVVIQLYTDHGFDPEKIHTAVSAYLN